MPLHEFCHIELGLLQHLNLADVAILDGEDGRCFPSDLVSDGSRDKLFYKGLQVSLGSQLGHGGNHLCANSSLLCGFGVACVLDLVVLRSGKGDAEHADHVTIGSLAVNITFNDGLLFADKTAKLVACHIHSMKVHETVVSLHILDTQLDLSVCQSFVLVQISETEFEYSSLQTIRGNLSTLCFGDQGLSGVLDGEDGGCDQFVPLFLQKGVNRLLTASLLTFRKSLILSLFIIKSKKKGC